MLEEQQTTLTPACLFRPGGDLLLLLVLGGSIFCVQPRTLVTRRLVGTFKKFRLYAKHPKFLKFSISHKFCTGATRYHQRNILPTLIVSLSSHTTQSSSTKNINNFILHQKFALKVLLSYQPPINFPSTFHRLSTNFLSTFHRLSIDFPPTFHQTQLSISLPSTFMRVF